MKNYIKGFWIVTVLLMMAGSVSIARSEMDKLTGFIEAAFAGGVKRINLPDLREFQIIERTFRVESFDLASTGANRIIAVAQKGNDPERLIMYSPNGSIKTVLGRNFVRFPTFSQDGKKIAYLFGDQSQVANKANIDWYLYVINSDGTGDKRVSSIALQLYRPSWFPDGNRIVVTTKDYKIALINVESGKISKIIDFGVGPVLSHNGDRIAFLTNNLDDATKQKLIDQQSISKKEEIEILNEKGKRLEERLELGKYISKHYIRIFELSSGRSRKVSDAEWIDGTPVWSPDDEYIAYSDDADVGEKIRVVNIRTGREEKLKGKQGKVMLWRKD